MHHHLVERSAILAESLTVVASLEGSLHVAALHDDNHGHSLLAGYQVVHNVLHAALLRPSSLVLAHAVLQVEHRIALLALLILGRRIHQRMAPLGCRRGIIADAAHLSMGYALLRTVIVTLPPFGNLYATSLTTAAEEGLRGRVNDVRATYIDKVIVEARH